jgi:hypothetical protein
MEHTSAGSEAGLFSDKFRYERHRPERTLFYQLVEQHYPSLVDLMAIQGKPLPRYVRREYEDYLKCGRLKHGFLRLRCDTCQAERLLVFSCKRLVICTSFGARRMVESAALLVDERAVSASVSICQQTGHHGQSPGHRLSHRLHAH